MMKHIASVSAALLLIAAAAVSCGETTAAPAETDNTITGNTAESTAAETEADILAYLPDTDLGGWQMDILCHEDAYSGTWTFTADALNGEVINDEIFERTRRIEERYNMVYNVIAEGNQWNTVGNVLRTSTAAGDDLYDMVIYYNYALQASMITGHYFYNMLEVPYLNFEKPWWHTEINDTYTLFGYLPCVLSDYSINSYQYANLLVFNKELAQSHDITGLYDLVRDHKWTLDSFYEIVKSVTSDTSGDGKMDQNDTWGFATNFGYHALTFAYAIGEMGVTVSEDGVGLGYRSEEFITLSEWLYDLLYGSKLAFEIGWGEVCDIGWDENRILFEAIWLNDLEDFRDYDISYGLLPYPLLDETQEKYYTYDDCRHGTFGIPITAAKENIDNTGLILEALSADSYHNVIPKYLDNVVTYKLSRDEDSLDMLNIIMDGRVYDFGYAIPDTFNYSWSICYDLQKSGGQMTSTLERYQKSTEKFYSDLIDAYKELGEMTW